MIRTQTRPVAPSTGLSPHHRRILAHSTLTSAAERALDRYIATRATHTPRRVTLARATSPAGVSA